MRQTSRPFQLGIHASPAISVTTNGPAPTLNVCSTAFDAGSTIEIVLSRTFGTHTLSATIAGSPGALPTLIVATTEFVAGSMRLIEPGRPCVIQTASSEAAVHVAPATATLARILFVAGSIRTTPSLASATQIEPNAATTPAGLVPILIFRTTLLRRGSIRSTVPPSAVVAH